MKTTCRVCGCDAYAQLCSSWCRDEYYWMRDREMGQKSISYELTIESGAEVVDKEIINARA